MLPWRGQTLPVASGFHCGMEIGRELTLPIVSALMPTNDMYKAEKIDLRMKNLKFCGCWRWEGPGENIHNWSLPIF